jgi:hypothetical protein
MHDPSGSMSEIPTSGSAAHITGARVAAVRLAA